MIRKCTIFVILLSLSFVSLHAQVSSLRIGVQSPTAASLGKFGDIPVNLYTGTPSISIPLYELKGRKLSVPITLNYHASGIKVEEIAGWVGLGWALNAGGVITRTVIGIPDDQVGGYHFTADDLYPGTNWSNNPSQSYIQDLKGEAADSEPDIFFFNFAGRSGKFVYGLADTVRSIPYQKLKIVPTQGAQQVTKWTITSENGTRYIFDAIFLLYAEKCHFQKVCLRC